MAESRRQRFPVLLIGLAALTSSWSGLAVGGLQPVDGFLAAAFACALGGLGRRRLWVPAYILVPAFAVCAIALLVTLAPPVLKEPAWHEAMGIATVTAPSDNVTAAAKWLVALLVVPLLCYRFIGTYGQVRFVAGMWVLGAAVCCAVGLTDAAGLTALNSQLSGVDALPGRQAGLSAHANILGFAAAMALPLVITMLRRRPLFAIALLPALVGGLYVSGSRGAQVGAVVGVVLAIVTQQRVRARSVVALGAASLVAWFVLPVLTDSGTGPEALLRFGSSGAVASDEGRLALAMHAVRDFQSSPLWGVGSIGLKYGHSIYLQILASGGLVLVVIMFWFFRSLLAEKVTQVGDEGIGRALKLSLFLWLLIGIVENPLTDRFLYFPVGLIVALAAMVRERQEQADDRDAATEPELIPAGRGPRAASRPSGRARRLR